MRERTSWNRAAIKAAASKQADDPRAMNQDHHSQQPSHEKYTIGDSSDFAEDVHPSAGTWKQEYSGGEVKRNEIGMPEMRGDTFNHPEKTASLDEATLLKKSNLCVKVATLMLPKAASQSLVEDQALSLMRLPDADLVSTYNRLAGVVASEDEDEDEDAEEEQQSKQAKDLPPEFLKNIEKKKDEAKGDDDKKQQSKEASDDDEQKEGQEDEKEQQSKEAALLKAATDQMQLMSQQMQQLQAQMQQMMQGQGQQQDLQMAQQGFPQLQQQMAQGQGQQQQMAQGQQQEMLADDQLLDQMLQDQLGDQALASEFQLQLDGSSMDVGETVFAAGEDDALRGLFSQDQEYQNAITAAGLQGLPVPGPAPVTAGVRTASTRTVGTRPSHGVSQLGGATSGGGGESSDVNRLTSLWQSAPDVSGVFRS